MNRKLLSALAVVCSVCILIIIGEWFYAERAQKQALNSSHAANTKRTHDEMPGIELTRQPETDYVDLVARPLFIKGRRPVDQSVSAGAEIINAANTFDWQLNGVYTAKKGLSALFSRSASRVAKDNFRRVIAGADLDGWKLTEIDKDRVLLKQGNQQKELLLRKPKLKELPKQLNVPNNPSNPQPNSPQPEVNAQPAEGELEKPNE